MKKLLIVTISLGVAFILGSIFVKNMYDSNKQISVLKDVDLNIGSYGIEKFEPTYENIVNQFSTNVAIGTIKGKELLNNEKEVFLVSVEEQILGETKSKDILVYTINNDLLELGEKYLLFLSEFNSTLYDKDFYVQSEEFVIKVLEDGSLVRLIDIYEKKYDTPFVNSKLNNIDELVAHTKANFSKPNNPNNNAIIQLDSKKMVDKADHIIEIKVLNMVELNNGLATVEYELIQKYKNGSFDNVHKLLLPKTAVQTNEEYLLFLSETENSTVTITARENSIIAKNNPAYNIIINELK